MPPLLMYTTVTTPTNMQSTAELEFSNVSVEITEGEQREMCQPRLTAGLENQFVVSIISKNGTAQCTLHLIIIIIYSE